VQPDPGLQLPIDAGDTVGMVEATAGGESLGRSSVVAATPVRIAVEEKEDEPWWERAMEAVGRFLTRVVRAIFG
jgi:hypothetical protein